MKIDDKIEFVQRATIAMAEETYPFIASIVGVDESNATPHVGSAFRLRLHGRRFIVTAGHVVDEALGRFGRVAVTGERGREPYLLTRDPDRVDDVHDFAVFEVAEDYPGNAVSFWLPDRMAKDDAMLSSDYLFVHGFPAVRSHYSAIAGGLINRSLPYGVMRREDELPPGILGFQFAMDFDPENFRGLDGSSAEWIDPHGLSGSAVWRIGASGGRIEDWSPQKSMLVGVVTQWRPDARCLIATRWTSIADLIPR
jgi:hypothetical protein